MRYFLSHIYKYVIGVVIVLTIILFGIFSSQPEDYDQNISSFEYYTFAQGSTCDIESSIEYIYDYDTFHRSDIDHMHSEEFFVDHHLIYLKDIQASSTDLFEVEKVVLVDNVIHVFYKIGYVQTSPSCKNIVIELPKTISFDEAIFYGSEEVVFHNNSKDLTITLFMLEENEIILILEESNGLYFCKTEGLLIENQVVIKDVYFTNSNFSIQDIVVSFTSTDYDYLYFDNSQYDFVN